MSQEAATTPIPGPPHSALVQTLIAAVRRSPDYADRFAERHGDIVQVRLLLPRIAGSGWPLRTGTVVLVSSPDLMREFFAKSGSSLAGGAPRQFTEWLFGSDSLLVLDDRRHREERAALLALFSPDRHARMEVTAREAVADAFARLPDEATLELRSVLDDVVTDVSVRLTFGRVDDVTACRLRECVQRGLSARGWDWPFLLFPWLRRDLGRFSPGGRAARLVAESRGLVTEEVSRVRAGRGLPDSWLTQLLALAGDSGDDGAATEQCVTRALTLLGGMDAVAVALQWCLRHLFEHPSMLARARDEARANESAYLEAVCRETLRLHAATPVALRLATAPTTLGAYRVEPGTYVVGCIFLLHRRPDVYDEPKRFRPERFLERTFAAHEYAPFGGGVRRCLGYGIGLQQMSLVLGELLRTFDFEPGRRPRLRIQRRAVFLVPVDPLTTTVRRVAPRPARAS